VTLVKKRTKETAKAAVTNRMLHLGAEQNFDLEAFDHQGN